MNFKPSPYVLSGVELVIGLAIAFVIGFAFAAFVFGIGAFH
jgi:hypothetical protein